MSSAKYLPLLARSLDRAAAAGGHARVPPIRLSRSAAARAIIPPFYSRVIPLSCPPRRSRASSPALLCWVNQARCSNAPNSQRRASRQSEHGAGLHLPRSSLHIFFLLLPLFTRFTSLVCHIDTHSRLQHSAHSLPPSFLPHAIFFPALSSRVCPWHDPKYAYLKDKDKI